MRKVINWIFWISLISLSLKLIFIISYWANIEKFLPPNGKPEMRFNEYSRRFAETEKFVIADSNYVDEWEFALDHDYNDSWEFVRSKWLWLYELGSFTLILLPLFFIRNQFNKIENKLYLSDLILFRPINISFIHLGIRRIFSLISNMPILVIVGASIFITVVWLPLLINERQFPNKILDLSVVSEICLSTIAVSSSIYMFLYLLMTIICWLVGGFKSEITSS